MKSSFWLWENIFSSVLARECPLALPSIFGFSSTLWFCLFFGFKNFYYFVRFEFICFKVFLMFYLWFRSLVHLLINLIVLNGFFSLIVFHLNLKRSPSLCYVSLLDVLIFPPKMLLLLSLSISPLCPRSALERLS